MLKKSRNLLLILSGYGLGQGSLFLSQTWLLAHGHLDRISEFGVAFYSFTLSTVFIDFGSTQYLSREVAGTLADEPSEDSAWIFYWRIAPVRILIAILAAAALFLLSRFSNIFSSGFFTFASPALLIWSLNATGLLDGMRLSGASGLSLAIPFLTSSLALALTASMPSEPSGQIIGAALSAGYIATLWVHLATLKWSGRRMIFVTPRIREICESSIHSGSAMLTTLPGQLYFRLQLGICSSILGSHPTAAFLYAKQISTAFGQLIAFMRRVEFPDLVKQIQTSSRPILHDLFMSQRFGILLALAGAFGVAIAGVSLLFYGRGAPQSNATALIAFAPTILTAALALGILQGQMALKRFRTAAAISTISISLAALASIALAPLVGVAGLATADAIGNLIVICMGVAMMRKPKGSAACLSQN